MTYLSTKNALKEFNVSRGTLVAMRERGIIHAVNINPGGERAVWRYADRLEVVDSDLEDELRWQKVKRGFGLSG